VLVGRVTTILSVRANGRKHARRKNPTIRHEMYASFFCIKITPHGNTGYTNTTRNTKQQHNNTPL